MKLIGQIKLSFGPDVTCRPKFASLCIKTHKLIQAVTQIAVNKNKQEKTETGFEPATSGKEASALAAELLSHV